LVLTRSEIIERLNEIIVVPATRTIRGLTTEVILSPDEGMPAMCGLNFDHVSLAQRSRIGPLLCELPEANWPEVRRALLNRLGLKVSVNEEDWRDISSRVNTESDNATLNTLRNAEVNP
jgi:mRNA interferase MazF